ncbi:MAG TPA: hypothetical protein VK971_01400 [Thiohalobacter sp.]|nr:hypothetical protein [Thiohalobacter sp.]
MEEDEYRATYDAVNQQRCVFEKAINNRRVGCSQMHRFYLADREGVGCQSEAANRRCIALLERMRRDARFALQLTHIDGPLPHNKEIRVQVGGLLGIQALVQPEKTGSGRVENAFDVLNRAEQRFGSIDAIPFNEVMKDIKQFQGRSRRQRG